MNLREYFDEQRGNGVALAQSLEIPLSYLSQMMSGDRAVSPERAVAIEEATNKKVTRKDLRPEDWQAIWPELREAAAA